jgi:RNA polymerase sigma-70 factor (ECF subfamily)
MKQYQASNEGAFTELFSRYDSRLRHFFALRLGSKYHSDAEDLIQITWLKIHKSRNSFDTSRRFAPWLFRLARNVLIDRYRQSDFELDESDWEQTEASTLNTEAVVFLREDLDQLNEILERLSSLQKECLLLSDLEGLSSEEVGLVLGISSVAVRQNLFRARSEVRQRWNHGVKVETRKP